MTFDHVGVLDIEINTLRPNRIKYDVTYVDIKKQLYFIELLVTILCKFFYFSTFPL